MPNDFMEVLTMSLKCTEALYMWASEVIDILGKRLEEDLGYGMEE